MHVTWTELELLKCKLFIYNSWFTINLLRINEIRAGFHKEKIILINWFEFYLSRKLFFVLLNELTSVPAILNFGFLHVSILEFIFLFYVKMIFLKHCQKRQKFVCYLVFLEKIEATLNKIFSSICYEFHRKKKLPICNSFSKTRVDWA